MGVQLKAEPRLVDAAGTTLASFRDLLHQPGGDVVVVRGLEAWNDAALAALDINRSAVERPGFVILWLARAHLDRFFRSAPNLASWIGGTIFQVGTDRGWMTEEHRRARLTELSSHYHLKPEDVIQMAANRSLPPDAAFVEWLVLLGREDLVK